MRKSPTECGVDGRTRRECLGVLCDRKMKVKIKGKVYRTNKLNAGFWLADYLAGDCCHSTGTDVLCFPFWFLQISVLLIISSTDT